MLKLLVDSTLSSENRNKQFLDHEPKDIASLESENKLDQKLDIFAIADTIKYLLTVQTHACIDKFHYFGMING